MREFVAGADRAIGRPLIDRLLAAGHDVTAMTRSEAQRGALRDPGSTACRRRAGPGGRDRRGRRGAAEVVVNQLTALPAKIPIWVYAKALGPINLLRREAAPILAQAAAASGARRPLAKSVAFFLAPQAGAILDEGAPTWTTRRAR